MSCNAQPEGTPLKYKNNYKVKKSTYIGDSTEISNILSKMLSKHLHPFRPETQFNSETDIHIDSIIYSPDELRMIVFVVTKNSTDKLFKKENGELFFYNANYLFCSRIDKNAPINVYDYVGYNLINYYSYKEIKEQLYEHCFIDLGKDDKYNVDDVRFWKSSDFNWIVEHSEATKAPL
jgi:hypothetical protein